MDTHGIIRGILITGNPTKHPHHPPVPFPVRNSLHTPSNGIEIEFIVALFNIEVGIIFILIKMCRYVGGNCIDIRFV